MSAGIRTPWPWAIFDRDGRLDVAATNSTSGAIAIFLHAKSTVTGVVTMPEAAQAPARLGQNYPNPFNPLTTVRYETKQPGRVRLAVFDVQGRLVKTLVDGAVPAGEHTVPWNGQTYTGSAAASGVYYYRLSTESGYVESRRMVLMR